MIKIDLNPFLTGVGAIIIVLVLWFMKLQTDPAIPWALVFAPVWFPALVFAANFMIKGGRNG